MKKTKANLLLTTNNSLLITNSHGFTLIEALVAIAIISLLSTIGVGNLSAFQKDSRLESFSSEFASSLESAKNKSVNSEIPSGYVLSDFDEDVLPYWVVDISSTKYSLYPVFKLADGTDATGNSEEVQIVSGNSIKPETSVNFERLTGKTTPTCFTAKVSGYSKEVEVYVDGSGNISHVCP